MFKIIVKADYALFTRPENKVERMTYPVPTPSALIGMLRSVFWKPAIEYEIHKIVVFNPISYVSVRRNEVKGKVLESAVKNQMKGGEKDPVIYTKEQISQRASLLLKDVCYGVEFSFRLTGVKSERDEDGNAKYAEIIRRRLEKGQFFSAPFLGAREFAVKEMKLVDSFDFSLVSPTLNGVQDLGFMLYRLNFKDDERKKEEWLPKYFSDAAEPEFYHVFMRDGVIDVDKCLRGEL